MEALETLKISIIIPVYKVKEEYLRCCVSSCTSQTYRNLEIILVEDGSPDRCGELCDSFAEEDPRIRVIHKENNGVSSARNAGIEASGGDWITFLDADDYLEPDACQLVVDQILRSTDMDLVAFTMVKDYEERLVYNQPMYSEDRDIAGPEAIEQLRKDVLEMQLDSNILRMTFCKVIRADILRDHNIRFNPKLPLCEDVVFWFEAIQHVNHAYYINRFLYHYRQVSDSATVRFRPNVVQEHTDLLQSLQKLIERTAHPEKYQEGWSLEAFYSMQRMITQGFFHEENPDSAADRSAACRKALGQPIYRDALRHIRISRLTTNHKIKYMLLRLRMYGGLELLRNLYGGLTGRKTE